MYQDAPRGAFFISAGLAKVLAVGIARAYIGFTGYMARSISDTPPCP
jgi:hypothetical protein